MSKLTINLVVNNGERYIPFLLSSLKAQTFKDWEMIIVDNGSTDRTIELIDAELRNSGIIYRVIHNSNNVGFAVGHNQASAEVKTPYFLIQNVDIFLASDVLEKTVAFLDIHADAAVAAPRLMRWDFAKGKDGFTNQIDALGVRLFRNRRAVEWLTRQEWSPTSASQEVREIFNKKTLEVFGVSGALALFRKSLVDKVLLPGNNLFDPTYHSYKEDLDLAYRLRNAGYVSYVLLDIVAYHDRTGAGPKEMGDLAALSNKKYQSYFVRYHSYKNHLRTLYKNEYWENIVRDWPFIFWYEFKKFIYFLFTDPRIIFDGGRDIIHNRKYTAAARRAIVAGRRLHWQGIRRWFL